MLGSILTAIIIFTLYSGWLYYYQPDMIFFPMRELSATPADWGLEYEDVDLNAADKTSLYGWYIPHTDSNLTLLFFHGNAGNISHRGESVEIFHRLGLNVFIFDYRGYGQSGGKPGESGFHDDARAAWGYLTKTKAIKRENIVLFGRSLGGAVAAKLAIEVHPGALILESTFSSAKDMANAVFPISSRLVPLRFDFNTASYIKQVAAPILIVHSIDDEIIPFRLGEKVFSAANHPKSLIKIKGNHNYGFLQSQPDYEQAIGEFLLALPTQGLADTPPL